MNGFDEDDNDGGLAGTYSRMNQRISVEPRECNCVFIRKPNWFKFYNRNNGVHIVCPGCKTRVGAMKLSGLKCSCGHWQTPAYQILRKMVRVNNAV